MMFGRKGKRKPDVERKPTPSRAAVRSERLVPTYDDQLVETPPNIPLVSLTHLERDAAREAIQRLHALCKVDHLRRLGSTQDAPIDSPEEERNLEIWRSQWSEPNSAQMIDEVVQAINSERCRRAERNLSLARERPWP